MLSALAMGSLVVGLASDTKWAFVGFAVFGGLAGVLYPRQFAGDPEQDVGAYSWVLPESQPARAIVTVLICGFLLALGLYAALR